MSRLRIPVSDQDHSVGPADAPVTLVEYGDYQCPYCGEAFPVVKELLQRYDGRIRFVFRNFPLQEIHPEAVDAAFVAEFAADHGDFWQAHDLLYENQSELGPQLYQRICEALGLSVTDLEAAARQNTYIPRIRADEEGGIRSGVNGTPTFFLNGVIVESGTAGLADAIRTALAPGA
ncbi:thioredoxin domain-containing protein [Microbacterium sp. SLBN-146]|uniref:DsbA family protein n=1 Tax=Microbacterium sp. SLBN-146 TaxID=2768457 RepID=UPI001150D234|nr:thioredoxin domain-containing protein [Microbacterium sp. SLBN-146]TQJ30013.1 protein-disulfide isomerase [Microbacterium sp. SLBN-146]